MLNIVMADIYRLTKGKSTWVFLGVSTLIFVMAMTLSGILIVPSRFKLILVSGLSVVSIGISVISLIRVYCDDVSSGSIHHLFAKMPNKIFYLIAKSIVLAIYTLFCFLVLGMVFFVVMAINTKGFEGGLNSYASIPTILSFSLKAFIGCFAMTMVSYNILVLTRKSGLSILFISLLATNFIDSIVELFSLLIKPLKYVKEYMITTYYMDSMYQLRSLTQLLIVAMCYIAFSFILQLLILKNRDFATE
jgi:hypothetical protein